MKRSHIRTGLEIIAWTAFIVFPMLLFPYGHARTAGGGVNPVLKSIFITHSLLIIFYYLNYYYLLPKFYFTKKYRRYIPLALLYLLSILVLLFSFPEFNFFPASVFPHYKIVFALSIILRFLMMFLLSLGFSSYQRLRQAEDERLRSELSLLRAQVNPHFLFNTLNSIYALTVIKSDLAPTSVTRLSAIMRYVMSDATQDLVPLQKELDYTSDYIELEKLRLTGNVKLVYSVNGDVNGKLIAPMMFIPLVENVFKHGVSTSGDPSISIIFKISGDSVKLSTVNTIARKESPGRKGMGLENVRRRLDLLYPGRYQLNIEQTPEEYSLDLTIRLNA
jgi:hypothetical protein